jgi:hypothetical protein
MITLFVVDIDFIILIFHPTEPPPPSSAQSFVYLTCHMSPNKEIGQKKRILMYFLYCTKKILLIYSIFDNVMSVCTE